MEEIGNYNLFLLSEIHPLSFSPKGGILKGVTYLQMALWGDSVPINWYESCLFILFRCLNTPDLCSFSSHDRNVFVHLLTKIKGGGFSEEAKLPLTTRALIKVD